MKKLLTIGIASAVVVAGGSAFAAKKVAQEKSEQIQAVLVEKANGLAIFGMRMDFKKISGTSAFNNDFTIEDLSVTAGNRQLIDTQSVTIEGLDLEQPEMTKDLRVILTGIQADISNAPFSRDLPELNGKVTGDISLSIQDKGRVDGKATADPVLQIAVDADLDQIVDLNSTALVSFDPAKAMLGGFSGLGRSGDAIKLSRFELEGNTDDIVRHIEAMAKKRNQTLEEYVLNRKFTRDKERAERKKDHNALKFMSAVETIVKNRGGDVSITVSSDTYKSLREIDRGGFTLEVDA